MNVLAFAVLYLTVLVCNGQVNELLSDEEIAEIIRERKWDDVPRSFKCRIYETLARYGGIVDGVLQEKVKEIFEIALLFSGIDNGNPQTCLVRTVQYIDACETAFQYYRCVMDNSVNAVKVIGPL